MVQKFEKKHNSGFISDLEFGSVAASIDGLYVLKNILVIESQDFS
jgi:hypothetical protein